MDGTRKRMEWYRNGGIITERLQALDKSCVILSGTDSKGLLQAVDTVVEMVNREKQGGAILHLIILISMYQIR